MKKMTWKHKVAFGAVLAIFVRRLIAGLQIPPEEPWVAQAQDGWWSLSMACIGLGFGIWASIPELRCWKERPLYWAGAALSALCILLILLARALVSSLPYLWLLVPFLLGLVMMYWDSWQEKKARQAEAEAAAREQDKPEK